ncbi:hypothetical protein WMY93_018695, partial [Mugilogobius chulae]
MEMLDRTTALVSPRLRGHGTSSPLSRPPGTTCTPGRLDIMFLLRLLRPPDILIQNTPLSPPSSRPCPRAGACPTHRAWTTSPWATAATAPPFTERPGASCRPLFQGPLVLWPTLKLEPDQSPGGHPAPLVSSTSSPLSSSASESQDAPIGPRTTRGSAVQRRDVSSPNAGDGLEPSLFSPDQDPGVSAEEGVPRKPNGSLPPLPIEDDSLASIPFI